MNRRMMMTLARSEESLLPSEYQQVEWIKTDGNCRIDSGVAFDGTKDFCLEAVSLIERTTDEPMYFGWNAGGIVGAYVDRNGPYWYDGSTNSAFVSANVQTKIEQTIYAGESSNTITKYTHIANSNETHTFTRGHANVSNRLALQNYPIFAVSKAPPDWSYSANYIRLYYIKLGFNSVFESHLIPCYRKSDNSIGMYDIIKKSFRPNLGTGTFTKGADVN